MHDGSSEKISSHKKFMGEVNWIELPYMPHDATINWKSNGTFLQAETFFDEKIALRLNFLWETN